MSETPSGNPPEPTIDQTRPTEAATIAPKTLGYVLYERVGVGGMGEVYRCGDDALERDLAIKVIKSALHGIADAEERFLREARLTGSLQHPGIVPIHQLGRLADGRPYYTMKLIRGRTFADMLRDEPQGPERLPRWLAVIEKVCQAVAYAHSRGVIHRDLKPANVMVGEFGEVQVMDWGLAKALRAPAPPEAASGVAVAAEPGETGEWVAEAAGLSRAGAALGTLAYMPPEQASGDWDIVDERADVFALGAVLCEVLTGRPPYHGSNREEVQRRVRHGDLTEAFDRLERWGAEAALVQLCRECLASEREGRPRNADGVAKRLAAYQADVQARLRRAEVERAEAQIQAREERKRRRLLAVLALAALLLLSAGVAAWWQWQRRRAEVDGSVAVALGQAQLLREQAKSDPLTAAVYEQALAAARNAREMSHAGGASASVQQQADDAFAQVRREAEEAAKDRRLLARLLDVRGPREGPKYRSDTQGNVMALAEQTAEEQFASAFRDWGLDVDAASTAEAAILLKKRPPAVVTEVIAALDEWANQRRQDRKPDAPWQRLAELAAALEDRPDPLRRELRDILARGRLPKERVLGMLATALRPALIPVPVPLGSDWLRLRELARQTKPAEVPVLGLLTLARALGQAGEEELAERLLRAALVARPREVVLHHTLGQLFATHHPPLWRDAVECHAAARVLRPDLGVNLAAALLRCGRDEEGLAVLARLVEKSPKNPWLHFSQAYYLSGQGRLDEAMAELRQAIVLDPEYGQAHNNLGASLSAKGHLNEAMAEFRRAIALDPKFAPAPYNLGRALYAKGRAEEAMTEFRRAIALDPTFAPPHNNLGLALADKGHWDEAMVEYRQAIALDPKLAPAHYNFGKALYAKRRWDEAMAEYRQAIALDPKDAETHTNLGNVLYSKGHLDEAMAEYRQAIALDPKLAPPHINLGTALRAKGRWDEALVQFRQAIALDPKHAFAHAALGEALLQQGRYVEARESSQTALGLFPTNSPFRQAALQLLHNCDRTIVLDKQLPAILRGEASTANPGDAVALAQLCQQPYQKRYAASARLYANAFAAEPKFAADLTQQHRYNAACSAALAAAGQGNDAHLLPDKVAAMFRWWALRWLRDDLTIYAQFADRHNPQMNSFLQQRMAHWRRDADLASVRDPQALARLPAHEPAAWHALWRDVEELAKLLSK